MSKWVSLFFSAANLLHSSNNKTQSWWVKIYQNSLHYVKPYTAQFLLSLPCLNAFLFMFMYVFSFGLEVDQKRNQFKERGRSMNSTGSGKSSTVSRSVYLFIPSWPSLQEVTQRYAPFLNGLKGEQLPTLTRDNQRQRHHSKVQTHGLY